MTSSAPETTSLVGIRRVIANRMMASLQQSAQVTYHAEIDITHLNAVRAALPSSHRSSLKDHILHATAGALVAHPALNAVINGHLVTTYDTVNIALAIATPKGLVTAVLRNLEDKSPTDIGNLRRPLVARAVEGRLQVSEQKGGTFTVSNLGHTPVRFFTPIINADQAAILGVGRAFPKLAVGQEVEWSLPVSLTADHRWIDGEPAGRFLATLADRMRPHPD